MMKIKRAAFGLMVAAALSGMALTTEPAFAGTGGFIRNSKVTDSVTDNGGTWTYNYTVYNTSFFGPSGDITRPVIVDWELPWFGDAGINTTTITSPRNWNWSIETIGTPNAATGWEGEASWQAPGDDFYAGANSPFTHVTQVLHWYNECWAGRQQNTLTFDVFALAVCEFQFDNAIFMPDEGSDGSLGGFGFTADYDQTAAPYQASWANLPVRSGDPAFPLGGIPASPLAIGINAVPLPGVLMLLGGGLLAFGVSRRFRKS